FVQIFSLAFLAYHIFRTQTLRQAALAGFLFGIANFALGLYWLYISMHNYGGMPAWLAGAAVLLLAAGLALFTTLATSLARKLSASHLQNFSNYRWQLL